jgi:hypothetical protein
MTWLNPACPFRVWRPLSRPIVPVLLPRHPFLRGPAFFTAWPRGGWSASQGHNRIFASHLPPPYARGARRRAAGYRRDSAGVSMGKEAPYRGPSPPPRTLSPPSLLLVSPMVWRRRTAKDIWGFLRGTRRRPAMREKPRRPPRLT